MNRVARVFSETDVLETEIRRKTDELERLKRQLNNTRGDSPVLREVQDADEIPADVVGSDKVIPLAELERRYVLKVLERFNGNRTHTARALGIGTNTLWRKLKAWGQPPARG